MSYDAAAAFGGGGPGRRRGGGRWVAFVVVGALGLVAGVGLGAAGVGEVLGDGATETVTAAAETVTVRDAARTRTVTKVRTRVRTVGSDRIRTVDGYRFTGDGGLKLPPIVVDEASTLRWTNDGGLFQVWDDDYAVSVNSQGERGQTYVEPGRYRLEVNAVGAWTFEITPN